MHWLIRPMTIESDKIKELVSILDAYSMSYTYVFPDMDTMQIMCLDSKKPFVFDTNTQYFVSGSYTIAQMVAKIVPSSVFTLDHLSFENLMAIFGKDHFLNKDTRVCSVHSLPEGLFFARPVSDTKSFNGGVYTRESLKTKDSAVMVAPIKSIYKEHRFFVIDNVVVTGSLYKLNGQLCTSRVVDEDAKLFAQEMAKRWNFPGYVLDIASTEDGLKIVELNCLNASGFYESDLSKIVDGLYSHFYTQSVKYTP